MGIHYFITGTELPLSAYKIVEVMEVEMHKETGEVFNSTFNGFTEKDPECTYFWSVYLRQNTYEAGFYSAECVADLPTEEAADALASALTLAIKHINQEA